MTDDIAITPGSGVIVATDEISGRHFQHVKVNWGAEGSVNQADITTGKPLPIQLRSATGLVPIGEPTDAKSAATDGTSVSLVSLLKQISDSGQATALNTGGTLATNDGASDANTTRVTISGVTHDTTDGATYGTKAQARASTSLSGLTLVSDADRTNLFAGVDGALIVRPHCNLEDIITGNANNTDGTSTQCIAAGAAGIKSYLTSVVLTNTSASNIYVEIKDGATAKLTIPLPANSGAVFNPPVPVPGTAATAWNFDPSAAASTVYCSMIAFKSKV